jgi:hypothetical protein
VACCPAKSFTIGGEAVALGLEGLSRFEELSHWEAARTAIHYAFDLIEHAREDLRNLPFLDRKAALVRLLRDTEAGHHVQRTEDGPTVFAHACRLGAEGDRVEEDRCTYRSSPCRAGVKVRNPASIAVRREHSEKWNRCPSKLGTDRNGTDAAGVGLAREAGAGVPHAAPAPARQALPEDRGLIDRSDTQGDDPPQRRNHAK